MLRCLPPPTPLFIYYSVHSRGYSLKVLLVMVLAYFSIRHVGNPTVRGAILLSAISALGILTVPTMALAVAGIYLWILLVLYKKGDRLVDITWNFLVPAGLCTIVFTLLLYLPVFMTMGGTEAVTSNRFVRPLSWSQFVQEFVPHVYLIMEDYSLDIPVVVLLTGVLLSIVGVVFAYRRGDFFIVALPTCLIVGGLSLLAVRQNIPFTRSWLYMVPFVMIAMDYGCTAITEKGNIVFRFATRSIVLVLCVMVLVPIGTKGQLAYNRKSFNAEAHVKSLAPLMTTIDRLHVREPLIWPAYYYMWYHEIPRVTPEDGGATPKVYAILGSREQQSMGSRLDSSRLLYTGIVANTYVFDSE